MNKEIDIPKDPQELEEILRITDPEIFGKKY